MRHMKKDCIPATALLLASPFLAAQQPLTWQVQLSDSQPDSQNAQIVATYDSVRQRAVFLLGQFPSNRTIEWDGAAWIDHGVTQVTLSGLVATAQAIGFDPNAQRTVAFGGFAYPIMLDATWTWDGATWTQRSPTQVPPARRDAGMFFDEVRQALILVAGTGNNGISPPNPSLERSDTWQWTGTDWVQLAPATSPAAGACLATYDSARDRGVLVPRAGGSVWEFDGNDWTEVVPATTPTQIAGGSLTFDAVRQRALLQVLDETWEWSGTDWALVGTGGPTPTMPVVFDKVTQRTLLANTRTWLSQNSAAQFVATATPYGAGCGSPELELRVESLPLIGQAGVVRVAPLPVQVTGVTTAWVSVGFATLTGFAWPTPDCLWHHTSEVFGLPAYSSGLWWLDLPYDPNLRGVELYLQGLALAPGQNPAWLILSNGVRWQIGDSQ